MMCVWCLQHVCVRHVGVTGDGGGSRVCSCCATRGTETLMRCMHVCMCVFVCVLELASSAALLGCDALCSCIWVLLEPVKKAAGSDNKHTHTHTHTHTHPASIFVLFLSRHSERLSVGMKMMTNTFHPYTSSVFVFWGAQLRLGGLYLLCLDFKLIGLVSDHSSVYQH